eukprot:TRINITY_DN75240_c0_g1_i1.p1 TRINITY_DN75240_c0_g1~~TRINITY_DN75240_c0_g1_i1.p1  ORF type:complete len:400 (+),score=42.83 TRINITY_DN75240_c0_g1_i1:166-1365(+)
MVSDEEKVKPANLQASWKMTYSHGRCICAAILFTFLLIIIGQANGDTNESLYVTEELAGLESAPRVSALSAKKRRASFDQASTSSVGKMHKASRAHMDEMADSSVKQMGNERADGFEEQQLPQSRMLVKSGRMILRSERGREVLRNVVLAVNTLVTSHHGYVESTSENTVSMGCYHRRCRSRYASDGEQDTDGVSRDDADWQERQRALNGEHLEVLLKIRVPVNEFDNLYRACSSISRTTVLEEGYDVEDVTARYVDAAARQSALQATHDQLLTIMKKADAVSDVLKVQAQLSKVDQDLESYKQQTRWLERESSMSKLSLTVKESEPNFHMLSTAPQISRPWRAFQNGIYFWNEVLASAVDGSVYVCVFGMPLACVGGVVFLVVRKARCKGSTGPDSRV